MIFVTLLLTSILGFSSFHSGHMAEYRYSLNENGIRLMVMMDLDDLEYFKTDISCDYTQMGSLCTSKYITTNSSLYINNKPIKFTFDESHTKKDHFYIYFLSETKVKQVKNISVYNNCFYEYKPGFNNRIILDIESFEGSYLLTKDENHINLKK